MSSARASSCCRQAIATLITALGGHWQARHRDDKDAFSADKLRYHRIIIMT
jgi:DNA gyrase/topoisomerase IV subunit B